MEPCDPELYLTSAVIILEIHIPFKSDTVNKRQTVLHPTFHDVKFNILDATINSKILERKKH